MPGRVCCRSAAAMLLACTASPALPHGTDADAGPGWLAWNTQWWLWAMLLIPAALYLLGIRNLWRNASVGAGIGRWRVGAFVAGWLALVLAIASPLDALGAELFAAHMVQHEVLMLIAAPLLVAGRPFAPMVWGLPRRVRPWVGRGSTALGLRYALHALGSPLAAWSIHASVLWIWHAPLLFQAALGRGPIHDLQHASFFLSALLFWWALLRGSQGGGNAGIGLFYLFTTLLHTSVLGALLAFSARPWYAPYETTAPSWGLTALEDQQLGGLIMWVPGGFVYLVAGLVLMMSLLSVAERRR